ncbi:MAG: hypothetical protein FWF01_02545 [Alphaproteobacteria bacterium]|nr:hypothetical protein [Alphaproteobacteria bacterium]
MLPQLDTYWYPAQVFWLGVAFALLFLAVNFVIAPRLFQIVDGRKRIVQADLQQAETLTGEAKMVLESYNMAIEAAKQEISDMIASAAKAENQKIALWKEQCSERVERALNEAIEKTAEKEAELREKLAADVAGITAMALKEWTVDNISPGVIKSEAANIYRGRAGNA